MVRLCRAPVPADRRCSTRPRRLPTPAADRPPPRCAPVRSPSSTRKATPGTRARWRLLRPPPTSASGVISGSSSPWRPPSSCSPPTPPPPPARSGPAASPPGWREPRSPPGSSSSSAWPPGRRPNGLEPLLAHELTHVILKADYPAHDGWPLWFQEGLAMRESRTEGVREYVTLSAAALFDRMLPLESLSASFPAAEAEARLAYAQSASFLAFLDAQSGRGRFAILMRELRGRGFEEAFRSRLRDGNRRGRGAVAAVGQPPLRLGARRDQRDRLLAADHPALPRGHRGPPAPLPPDARALGAGRARSRTG